MNTAVVNLAYLVAAVLFIYTFKLLSHPRTAVKGNLLGAVGMLIAIVVTLLDRHIVDYKVILAGIVVGSAAGAVLALKIQMTGMPQMVALLNGFGGAASTLVGGAALVEMQLTLVPETDPLQSVIATAASGFIGAITFWGSLVAYLKLEERIVPTRPVLFKGQHALNAALGVVALAFAVWLVADPTANLAYWLLAAVSSALGVLLVIPIGGADMPIIICLLNSYSGLAAAATGFVLNNNMLIVAGSLVGASGIILTQIMCKAMNRSMANVLFGGFGAEASTAKADDVYGGKVKASSPEEIAMILDSARRVVIAPGYGMAVSQAQHAVRDLMNILESKGVEVEFAIHPVAGRMPGHMNVLLAEANIPYDKMKEMDEINPTFEQTDVAIVIGANDTVNPIARTDPKSPIAGMPILNVDKARTVVVVKRSLSPGFAGIPNPLFAADNALMYFADGKKAILDLVAAIKAG